jgi:hypothetical protein
MDPVTGGVIIVGMVCLVAVGTLITIAVESDSETKQYLAEALSSLLRTATQLAMIASL